MNRHLGMRIGFVLYRRAVVSVLEGCQRDGLVYVVRFWDTRGRLQSSIRVGDRMYQYYKRCITTRGQATDV